MFFGFAAFALVLRRINKRETSKSVRDSNALPPGFWLMLNIFPPNYLAFVAGTPREEVAQFAEEMLRVARSPMKKT